MYLGTKLVSDDVMCNKVTTSGLKVKFFTQILTGKNLSLFLRLAFLLEVLYYVLFDTMNVDTVRITLKRKLDTDVSETLLLCRTLRGAERVGEGRGEVERGRFIILTPSSPRQIIIANNDSPRLPNPLPSLPSSITLIAPI